MLANLFRPMWNKIIAGIGKASVQIGISPDIWTFLSFGCAILSAFYINHNDFWQGLILSISMLVADAADGSTARAKGVVSEFGTILDHVIDRYAEFLIFGGILLNGKASTMIMLFSISGVLMASYVRAKAESINGIKNCAVGIAGRVEKLILTYFGIAFLALGLTNYANGTFFIVGLISHVTAIQRLLYARMLLAVPSESSQNIVNAES